MKGKPDVDNLFSLKMFQKQYRSFVKIIRFIMKAVRIDGSLSLFFIVTGMRV